MITPLHRDEERDFNLKKKIQKETRIVIEFKMIYAAKKDAIALGS